MGERRHTTTKNGGIIDHDARVRVCTKRYDRQKVKYVTGTPQISLIFRLIGTESLEAKNAVTFL
jgi:hypothetical protein